MSEQPPAGNGGAGDPKKSGSDPSSGGDRANALTRKLRKQEKELQTLRDAEEARKQGELSEVDKLKAALLKSQAENKTLADKMQKQQIQHRFEAAAVKAGAVDPEAAYRLADLSAVELDEDGKITGLDDALKSLQEQRGFLFQAPGEAAGSKGVGSTGAGGNPAGGNPASGVTTADKLREMPSEQFNKLAADVISGRATL